MGIEVRVFNQQPILLVELAGDVDASTAPEVQDQVLGYLSPDLCHVGVDMAQVGFLSSAGLRALLAILRKARSLGGDLRLARLQPEVGRVISMGFSNMVKTYNSLPGMLESYYHDLGISAPAESDNRWANADSFLNQMRQIGDPQADEVVQQLFEAESINAVNKLMKDLFTNDHVPSSELPAIVRRYLENTSELPRWADAERIRRGQALFNRYGMHCTTLLMFASLPSTYSARKGVHVLAMTQRISKNPYRRIMETAQMIIDSMQPDALSPGGMGFRSIQKVRLMHAAVRHLLLARGDWDMADYDFPINQEDMAGTMMSFSNTITSKLPLLGINAHPQEIEDYHHVWHVIGYLMGVMPELLPQNALDGAYMGNKILYRQLAYSNDGCELTANLLNMAHQYTPMSSQHQIPEAMIRYLCGDEVSDAIGVPPTNWESAMKPFKWASTFIDKADNVVPLMGRVSEVFIRRMLSSFLTFSLEGKRTAFRIPTSLQEDLREAELREEGAAS